MSLLPTTKAMVFLMLLIMMVLHIGIVTSVVNTIMLPTDSVANADAEYV